MRAAVVAKRIDLYRFFGPLGAPRIDFGLLNAHRKGLDDLSACLDYEGSGFAGRVPIAELLVVDPVLRKAIHDRKPTDEIYAVAVAGGMTPLLKDGLSRALAGETSLAEVMRVAG